MKPEALVKVKAALESGGATINQIIHGRPVGGGAVNRSLRLEGEHYRYSAVYICLKSHQYHEYPWYHRQSKAN